MPLQSATPVVLAFARYFARPACPQCGETQLAPEHSEFVRDGVIHHTWACDFLRPRVPHHGRVRARRRVTAKARAKMRGRKASEGRARPGAAFTIPVRYCF